MSPLSAGRSTGSDLRCDSANRSSAFSISSSGTCATSFSRPSAAKSGAGMSGRTSKRQRVFEVGAFGARHELIARRQRRPQIALANRLGRAVLHRALQNLAAHGRAVAFAQQGQRHLARTETGDPHHSPDFVEPLCDLVLDLVRRDRDLELALQPLGAGFGHIHGSVLTFLASVWACADLDCASWNCASLALPSARAPFSPPFPPPLRAGQDSGRWCGRGDLNPHDFHRWNLNPVRLPIPPRPRAAAAGMSAMPPRRSDPAPSNPVAVNPVAANIVTALQHGETRDQAVRVRPRTAEAATTRPSPRYAS